MKKFALISILCLWIYPLWGQNLTGIVQDQTTQTPIPRAHVRVLNSHYLTTTDEAGKFSLPADFAHPITLLITCLGFEDFYQTIDNQVVTNPIIQLKPQIIGLNKPIVITAKRLESDGFATAESINTLNQPQLLQNSPRTTPEALMGQAGIWVQKTNHGGGSAFVRGLTGNQVLLLVDGIRLNNSTFRYGPNQYLNTTDPLALSQIEALRGSGSVQYGSDAIGGAIQLLSKNPYFSEKSRLSGNVYLKYLNQAMEQTGRTELNFSSQKWAILGGFSYNNFGDLVAGEGIGKQSPSGYRQYAFDFKTRILLTKNQIITLAHQYLRQSQVPIYHKVRLENFAYNYFDPQSRRLTYARWEYFGKSKLGQKLSLTAFWNQTHEGRISQKNNSNLRTEEQDRVNTTGFNFEIQSKLHPNWDILSGIELYHDQVKSQKMSIDLSQNLATPKRGLYPDGSTMANWAVFSLHTFKWNKWQFTGGLRWNGLQIKVKDETLGESTLNPQALVGNLGIQYFLHPQHQIILRSNSAFRAPNIDDLGTLGIVDFRYEIPTFGLKPEKSWHYEIGYKAQTKHLTAQVSAFRNQLTDLIVRVKTTYNGQTQIDGKDVYRKENLAEAYIEGLETDFSLKIAQNFLMEGNLTYLLGQNITNNEPLRRIPPLNGRLSMTYQYHSSGWLRLDYNFADAQFRLAKGDQEDNRINPNGTPGWHIFNISAGYRARWMQLQAGLQNIFNVAYRMHGSGVDGYGRSLWLSTQISF
jgi:hemoglobin/transferrin/lactoferrin receptor protein